MDIPTVLFFSALAAIVLFFGYNILRHGGLKAAMFGARIERTVGEVGGQKQGPVGVALKVHVLHREPKEKLIGIELTAKSFASYQMMPITLSIPQAQALASLLQDAIRK
jgi:hypothetical protein